MIVIIIISLDIGLFPISVQKHFPRFVKHRLHVNAHVRRFSYQSRIKLSKKITLSLSSQSRSYTLFSLPYTGLYFIVIAMLLLHSGLSSYPLHGTTCSSPPTILCIVGIVRRVICYMICKN